MSTGKISGREALLKNTKPSKAIVEPAIPTDWARATDPSCPTYSETRERA